MRTEPTTRLRVRHELASVALVRNRLAADLRTRRLATDTVADAALLLSELITNAIRHTPNDGAIEVSWHIDPPALEVSVIDTSTALPKKEPLTPDAPSGRGLRIIEAISSSWGVDTLGHGKRVWARLPLIPPH